MCLHFQDGWRESRIFHDTWHEVSYHVRRSKDEENVNKVWKGWSASQRGKPEATSVGVPQVMCHECNNCHNQPLGECSVLWCRDTINKSYDKQSRDGAVVEERSRLQVGGVLKIAEKFSKIMKSLPVLNFDFLTTSLSDLAATKWSASIKLDISMQATDSCRQ